MGYRAEVIHHQSIYFSVMERYPPRPTAPSTHNANLQAPQSNSNFPKRSSSVPVLVSTTEEYPTEMARLCEMGFKDDQRNRQVLKHTQGRIDAAVDILSRLPGAPQSPAKPVFLTNEQKMQRLSEMGYSDIPENRDALRRSGGNLEVAVGILQNARKPAAQDNSVATTKPEPLSAFSSTTSNQQNEPAGRAQNSSERQNHTLSGLKTADLLNLLDDGSSNKPAATASNPFHQPAATPMQQQQQQPSYFATSTATNPFASSSSSLQIPFQQQQQQQQHTMVPSSSSLSSSPFANAGVPSQPTGFVPMNNGFSPMANTNPAPAANPWAATNAGDVTTTATCTSSNLNLHTSVRAFLAACSHNTHTHIYTQGEGD
ncbi:hypothetical protein BDB00DRAFT_288782 [Zychaea mexicana]|uniref:uncharacterized protein n=1 Tax=Zychaea mexicana TaxID=64656 RepID=UPI0022FE11F0|nr:uncharacterized protein BDB00DRAFT_288782 [Zychaea mexicana]KAI9494771.1 hypothetical protein BDB00DRAFT_288782 [Zychaea mexicana]